MNVAQLEAALKSAKEQEKQAGNAAWKELSDRAKGQLDWEVNWLDKYSLSVHARYKAEFIAEMEQLDKLHMSSYSRIHEEHRGWRGMTYLLINKVLVQSGGGWQVLDIPRKNVYRDWRELTEEQELCLHAGIVPEELKASWAKP